MHPDFDNSSSVKIFDLSDDNVCIFVLWYVACDMCVCDVNDLKKVSAFGM
jgi:hypothetical protein